MKIIYLANQRLPTEKAYGIQIAKMCEAFADYNPDTNKYLKIPDSRIDIELVVPYRKNKIKDNFFDYYSVRRNFEFKKIWSPDFYLPGKLDKLAVTVKSFISAALLSLYALQRKKVDIIFSRDEWPIFILSFFRNNLVFEAHRFSWKRRIFYRRFKKRNIKIVVISRGLKEDFVRFGFPPNNILVAHDGVDLEQFNILDNPKAYRDELGLPSDKKMIGYVGQLRTLGMEKGVTDLIEAFGELRKVSNDYVLAIVGGVEGDIEYYKKLVSRKGLTDHDVIFIGQKEHKLIPKYLKAFDILAIPFPNNKHYARYISPLKLFEYMASRRPIVASDLPSIREILNESNAVLMKPDSAESLAEGIKRILQSAELADKISKRAYQDVQNYTWQKRAGKILEFITQNFAK